jgi:effector-binding domain-containing protein
MEYEVQIMQVEYRLTAVVRCRAKLNELAQVVPQACGEVWAYFREAQLPRPARNLSLYLDDEINLECGVEVTQPFAGNGRVVCSRTPAGRVAVAEHIGPYDRLGKAHQFIRLWCETNNHRLAGPNWEVYGHWEDDPEKLRTDVFYLLKASADEAESPPLPE